MARCLVTGGTGFIGSNLAQRLMALGHEVIITGNRTEQSVKVHKMLEPSLLGIDWNEIKYIDVVFHQAANNDTTCKNRNEMMLANVTASEHLFERCLEAGCKHFVYASSTAIYGNEPAPYVEGKTVVNPANVYAESKAKLEEVAYGFSEYAKVVGLRYCNVYGPGECHKGKRASMITQLICQMAQGKRPRLFKYGEQQRDYIHVSDVVEANLSAWRYADSGVFNCGSGSTVSFSQLVEWINEYLGLQLEPEWIDNPHGAAYQNFTQCDMKRAEALLGFRPLISIKEGVGLTCAAYVAPGIHPAVVPHAAEEQNLHRQDQAVPVQRSHQQEP